MKFYRLITLQTLYLLGSVLCEPFQYTFDTWVDHNSAMEPGAKKFAMKYIVNDQYYTDQSGEEGTKPKPIFFYTGNEGAIWDFYKNSGFMTTTLAK